MSLLRAKFVWKCHILAKIYFIFLENPLKQSWNSINTKFRPQQKDRKSSYQVKQILAFFCNIIALTSGYNTVKGLRVTKLSKKLSLKGSGASWKQPKVSIDNHLQNIRLTLFFMGNSALREKFNFYFSRCFW